MKVTFQNSRVAAVTGWQNFAWHLSLPPNTEKKLFFIEDTSVIIHALSKEEEYPGVDVKYWMQSNDFLSVDKELKSVGNDRHFWYQAKFSMANFYFPPHR